MGNPIEELGDIRSYGDLRDFLRRYQTIVIGMCVVFIAIVFAWSCSRMGGGAGGGGRSDVAVWFYDLQAKQLFQADPDDVPPIEAPSGGEGVRAYVYSCGACTQDARRIARLERYTPESKQAFERYLELRDDGRGGTAEAVAALGDADRGRRVSRLDPLDWQPAYSEKGLAITRSPGLDCAKPKRCKP